MSTSDTNTSASDWWDSIAVFSDDYTPDDYSPSDSVETNHALLKGLRERDFDPDDTAYTYGLLTLAVVFLVAGVLACVCLPCLYQCAGKSRQERLQERLKTRERHGETANGILMLIFSVLAIASAAGAIDGLEKTDSGLTSIEGHTQEVADDLRTALDLVNTTSAQLDEVSSSYASLLEAAELCEPDLSGALPDDFDSLVSELQGELDDLTSGPVEEFAADVEGVADTVHVTDGIRKGVVWPAMALSLLVIVGFVIIGLSAYGCIACGATPCGPITCIVLPGTIFISVVIWLSAASGVTLSALSGDFCIDADTHAQDLVLDSSSSATVEELVLYYTGDCTTDNSVLDAIIDAQEVALEASQTLLPQLYLLSGICEDLQPSVELVDDNFQEVWNTLEDAAEVTSCRNINGLYQSAVYDDLCDSLPEGLLGFWLSCVFLTVLLLLLAVLWGYMLRRHKTDEDFERVRASAKRNGIWTKSFRLSKAYASNASRGPSGMSSRSSASGQHVATSGRLSAPYGGSASGPAGNPPVQRPVEMRQPQRPSSHR